jgi:DNA-binding NarL/FixJ family response regulator
MAIVLWVGNTSRELVSQAEGLGIRAILRKTMPAERQVACLRAVCEGAEWFEKGLTDGPLGVRGVALTRRQGQLVHLLTQGLHNREIAEALGITEGAVKVYLSRLFNKLGVKDRFEMALFGLMNLPAGPFPTGANGHGTVRGSMPDFSEPETEQTAAQPLLRWMVAEGGRR